LGYTQEVATLNNIAILYGDEKKFEKSEKYVITAHEIVKKQNDSIRSGHYAINLAILYARMENYTKSKNLLYEALDYIDNSDEVLQLKAWTVLTGVYVSLNDFEKAKKIIDQIYDKAEQLSQKDIFVTL